MSQTGIVQSVRANASLKPPIINPLFLHQLQASNFKPRSVQKDCPEERRCLAEVEASPLKRMKTVLDVSSERPDNIKERGPQKCHVSLTQTATSPKNFSYTSTSSVTGLSNVTSFKRRRDGKYLERRLKNNMAAKKSRDQRKIRELSLNDRAGSLSQENALLKAELSQLRSELTALKVAQFQKEILQEQQRASEGLFWQTATLNFLLEQLKRSHQLDLSSLGAGHPLLSPSPDLQPHFADDNHLTESPEEDVEVTSIKEEIDVEEHKIKIEVQTDQGD